MICALLRILSCDENGVAAPPVSTAALVHAVGNGITLDACRR